MVKKYITALGISAVAISMNAIEANAMEKGIVIASTLNIRNGPSTSNTVVGKLNKGQSIELLEKGRDWHKVKISNGIIGWVSSQYIYLQQNSDVSNSQYMNKKGIVKANSLNIRNGAGTSYSVITKTSNGTVIDLLEKSSNGWYKLKLPNGSIGWASSDYISEYTSTDTQQPTTSIQGKKAKVNTSSLNIRSGAGTNYSVVTKATNETVVDLLEKSSNGWYKLKLPNGTVGWASESYLVETTQSSNETTSNQSPPASSNKNTVVSFAYSLLGKTYEWGASGPNSFDCSGFTQYVYKNVEGKNIPRVSRDQARYGEEVSKDNLLPGDLVYFDNNGDGVVNHVGIYIGSNEFIHCSGTSTKPDKVKISSLNSSYYSKALKGGRRF